MALLVSSKTSLVLNLHRRAWAATQEGRFDNEIIGIEGHDAQGRLQLCTVDVSDPS